MDEADGLDGHLNIGQLGGARFGEPGFSHDFVDGDILLLREFG